MGEPTWPLGDDQRSLLSLFAELIARDPWRFLHAPVVASDPRDYPDPWHGDRASVAQVIARTLWHAHLSIPTRVLDVRSPGDPQRNALRSTRLQLTEIDEDGTVFTLWSLGNDDVAGDAAHEVGRLAVASLGHEAGPFRAGDGRELPSAMLGSVATVWLGLGVVAANAAHHVRTSGRAGGRSEQAISRAGGVPVDDLAFLLAVQATLRDDVISALASLRPTQAALVSRWRAVLDDHERELADMLGLRDLGTPVPVSRPAAPTPVTIDANGIDERQIRKPNFGRSVYRYPAGRMLGRSMLCSFASGSSCVAASMALGWSQGVLASILVGAAFGIWGFKTTQPVWRCASCENIVERTTPICVACGGNLVGEIAHPADRFDMQ